MRADCGFESKVCTNAHCLDILLHNLAQQKQLCKVQGAHKGKVSGLCFAGEHRVLSCGVDRNVKLWDVHPSLDATDAESSKVRTMCILLKLMLIPCRNSC